MAQTVRSTAVTDKRAKNLGATVEALTRRNHEWVFVSRKRIIFESWRHAVKQQKAFMLCVVNVLQKSMTMKGFYYIQNVTRETKSNDRKYHSINQLLLKCAKHNIGDFFNKWKLMASNQVGSKYEIVKVLNS